MLQSYSIFFVIIVAGSSLLAMDKQDSKNSTSYHMESKLSGMDKSNEGKTTFTFSYSDGSKSSYNVYSSSSNKKN